jgi:hypothetical protein
VEHRREQGDQRRRALRLAALLRERVRAIERLDPPEYNQIYPRYKGLNPMLAEAAKAIGKLARRAIACSSTSSRTSA